MAANLFYLAAVFGDSEWQGIAQEMAAGFSSRVITYPGSFCIWASQILQQAYGTSQIVLTGSAIDTSRRAILQHFLPGTILLGADESIPSISLFDGKDFHNDSMIYWCTNNSCRPPVKSPDELFLMMKS